MSKLIKLTKGQWAIVDDDDFERTNQHKWYYGTAGYAQRDKTSGGKRKRFTMHREIMCAPDGMEVDHINGNRLDNRKENLRLCTHAENGRNVKLPSRSTSSFKGVTWAKGSNAWACQIHKDGERYHLGLYESKIEAAEVYDRAALHLFGEFAKLNFPEKRESCVPGLIEKTFSSPYRGVGWHKATNSFQARITVDGNRIRLGHFESDVDAAKAYNDAVKFYGMPYKLNVVP